MEDQQILALFARRDETAIAETDAIYGRRLLQIAGNILQSKEDAEESVNDTYWKAWNAIPPERPVRLFAYLAQICRRCALGRLDWNQAEKRSARVVELTAEMEACIPDRSAELDLGGRELESLLNRFLEGLPAESRILFVRRYWYAESIQEIAVRYGFSESKIKTQLHRTRRKLHNFLESEGFRL